MSELNGSSRIQDGSAQGLLDFLEYVVKRGYGSASAVSPWRSAARQVLQTVERSEDFADVDIRKLDLDEYLERFDTLARGKIKVESVQAYRRRFTNAVEAYLAFIQEGKPPTFRQGARRPKAEARAEPRPTDSAPPARPAPADSQQAAPGDRMVEYPFPLASGQIGILRLPVRLDKTDADRLGAFVRTLVLEPQKELTKGGGEEDRGS
jgi:hypothetical protein